ncbi:1730_t:CDS:2, partial [Acaulospora morrowiae]
NPNESSETGSNRRNESFIPLNPLTSEEIRDFQRNSKKRRRSVDFDRWRKPSKSETPWIVEESKIEYTSVTQRQLVEYLSPTDVERSLRSFVIKRVELAIKKEFPDAEIVPFGSVNTGLYLPTSDIDLVCFIHLQTPSSLRLVSEILVDQEICANKPNTIFNAVVPIIKFRERYTNFNVDISFNQASGFVSARAIKKLKKEWPSLEKLVIVVKHFLRHHALDDPSMGGMGGFTVFCMMLSFFQLHHQIQEGTVVPEDENLGVILIEFFELYGFNFEYEKLAIRIKSPDGYGYYPKENEPWANKNPKTNLCIQDPTDEGNDISRSTRNMDYIRLQFQRAFKRLVVRVGHLSRILPRDDGKFPELQKESILSSILFVEQNIQDVRRKHANDYHEFLEKLIAPLGDSLYKITSSNDFEYISREFKTEILCADRLRIEKADRTKRKFNQSRSHDSHIYARSQISNYQSLVSRIEEYDYDRDRRNKRYSSSGRRDNSSLYIEDVSDMEMDSDYESYHNHKYSSKRRRTKNRRRS